MNHRRWCGIVGFLLLIIFSPVSGRVRGATLLSTISNTIDDNDKDDKDESIVFPTLEETWDMVFLSNAVYNFVGSSSCEDGPWEEALSDRFSCEYYEDSKQDTQVLIVTSRHSDYVAVVYAGTDDWRNWATDSNTWKTAFGTHSSNKNRTMAPLDVQIHQGFDYAVFGQGVYDRVEAMTLSLLAAPSHRRRHRHRHRRRRRRLFLTGHSLGGADAVITAMAMHPKLLELGVSTTVLNFGCPRIGNGHWKDWVNSQTRLGLHIWRFVNGNDIVSRMPQVRFEHVGHTVQLTGKSTKAYYLHHGGGNYSGVPFGWSTKPFALLPFSAMAHHIKHYVEFIGNKAQTDPANYYFEDFEYKKSDDKEEEEDDDDDDDDSFEEDMWDEEEDEYDSSSALFFGPLEEDVQHHAAVKVE